MFFEVRRLRLALLLVALFSAGCIQVKSTSNAPTTFEKTQKLCRDQSEYYDQPDQAFTRCMRRLGYPETNPEDY